MGEMADLTLDQFYDPWQGDDEWEPMPTKRSVRCKYCHCVGLQWKHTDKGWRLIDDNGILHTCKEYRRRR